MHRPFWPFYLSLLLVCVSGLRAEQRPNIIFLLTDDQRDNSLGAMGHPFVQTPHLDGLMRDSVRFRNAYIATPVCSPSRVSYFTGMPERVHGVGFSSSYDLTDAQWEQTYPALLRRSGYHTGFIGKFGVEYYTFQGRASEQFDFWWGHDGWTKFLPKDFRSPSTLPYHSAKADLITPIMGEAMTKFLGEAPTGKPFCLSVSFNVPHGSQTSSMHTGYPEWQRMTRPANENPALQGTPFYDGLYRDIEIPLPPDLGTDPYRFIPKFILDQDKGRRNQTYVYNYQADTCREHHIRYYQTITGLDHVIGGLLADLRERGLDQNTVILFGSDHGLLMGEYGMGGKELLLDLAAKIPCFVHDPRLPKEQRGRQIDPLVSSLDVTRTILDYAGVEAPPQMEGRSLRPLVEGREVDWRQELFLESLFTMRDNPFQEGLRTDRWKYIRMYDGVMNFKETDVDFQGRAPEFEMLFDLESDPGERVNVASDPSHASVLGELRSKTAAESVAINQRRTAFAKAFPPHPRATAAVKKDASIALLNGRDLTGWDGDPALWTVKDGIVTGICTGPDNLAHNSFLIWRGGMVKNFELTALVRVTGDNNSGIQYRSRPLPEAGPWGIAGYQCDIHPAIEHTGMTYEEKGRGIFGLNGKSVVVDPDGGRWLTGEHEPVRVNVADWNEYTVIARGNRLIHKVNGQVTSELVDCDESGRSLEGLLAIQLHRGNANKVEIKDMRLKVLADGELIPFDSTKLPPGARQIERPGTKNPQGLGPASSPR